jgi:hypothetical protein
MDSESKKNCNTEIAIEPIVTVVAKVREVPRVCMHYILYYCMYGMTYNYINRYQVF